MYRIEKNLVEGVEQLPDLVHTPIWKQYARLPCQKSVKLVACLYSAIEKRENYYQLNTPPVLEELKYPYYCGVVDGILQLGGMKEEEKKETIIIRKGKKKILVIDKVKRPGSFSEVVKENHERILASER